MNASTTSEPACTNSRCSSVDLLGVVEHDLGHEGAGLQVAAALELEQVALGADHRALVEPLQQTQRRGVLAHVCTPDAIALPYCQLLMVIRQLLMSRNATTTR